MRMISMMIVVALFAGCSDAAAPAAPAINGTYQLQTLRGEPLPATTYEDANYAYKITGGSITLNGDRTFSDSYGYWQFNLGQVTTGTHACTGYWTPTSERTFTLQESSTFGCGQGATGEWDGRNRVTIAWEVFGTAVHGRPWTIEDITR